MGVAFLRYRKPVLQIILAVSILTGTFFLFTNQVLAACSYCGPGGISGTCGKTGGCNNYCTSYPYGGKWAAEGFPSTSFGETFQSTDGICDSQSEALSCACGSAGGQGCVGRGAKDKGGGCCGGMVPDANGICQGCSTEDTDPSACTANGGTWGRTVPSCIDSNGAEKACFDTQGNQVCTPIGSGSSCNSTGSCNWQSDNGTSYGCYSCTCGGPPPTNTPYPDFIITKIVIADGVSGTPAFAKVTVKNQGSVGTLSRVDVAWDRNGTSLSCGQGNQIGGFNRLAAGEEKTALISGFNYPATPGPYVAVARADSNTVSCPIRESNENNNTKTVAYRSLPAGCTIPGAPTNLTAVQDPADPEPGRYIFSWTAGSGPISSYTLRITSPFYYPVTNILTTQYKWPFPLNPGTYTWDVTANYAACSTASPAATKITQICYDRNLQVTTDPVSCTGSRPSLITNIGDNIPGLIPVPKTVPINSNQSYNLKFNGSGFTVSPPTAFVPSQCTGTTTINLSCIDTTTSYFQTFGGGVTAASGALTNDYLPDDKFLIDNLPSQPISAGVLAANSSLTGIAKKSPPEWYLQNYETSETITSGLMYDNYLQQALKFGSKDPTDPTTACGGSAVTVNGKTVKYFCYGSGGADNLNLIAGQAKNDSSNIVILIPKSSSINPSFSTNVTLTNKEMLVFVPGNLTITGQVAVTQNVSSAISFIVNGNIDVSSSITQLDGAYIMSGTFNSGAGTSPLTGKGMVIALGDSLTLQRSPTGGGLGESFSYEPKYLALLKSILTRPRTRWGELAPQ